MENQEDLAQQLAAFFDLKVLPIEGGLFTQTYKSREVYPQSGLPARYPNDKPFGTAIVYLYNTDPDCFSAMHRLPTDEIYHFYLGDPVEMQLLYPDGRSETVIFGQDILHGQKVQFVVPRGVWQGSHLKDGGKLALIGTTMAPGYEDEDYEAGEREALIAAYPAAAELITRLTRLE
jgi:predicted cupin superfamily sugar epimerase